MRYIETPCIPKNQVVLAVVDYRISAEAEASLTSMGMELIKTMPCPDLYEAINGHPDIILYPVGHDRVILAPNVYGSLAPTLEKKGFAVTKGATWLARNYPENIAYNVLRIGGLAFHHTGHTDPEILKVLEEQQIQLVHVNQGYSKCAVCILDERHIITSDYKLAQTTEKYGVESLLVKPGSIGLTGMEYGFIGGASGLISEKSIAFTGTIEQHEDGVKIAAYIEKCGLDLVSLNTGQMTDIGSILPLFQK